MSLLRRRKPAKKATPKPAPKKSSVRDQEKNLAKFRTMARTIVLEAKDEAVSIKNNALAKARAELKEINNHSARLKQQSQILEKKELKLKATQEVLDEAEKQYKKKQQNLTKKLEKISSLTSLEAKKELLEQIEKSAQADIARTIKEAEEKATQEADDVAKEILVEAIRAGATDYVSEYTVSTIKIPNEEIKSRVIGKEGRNIRAFEKVTGTDLIMDETPGEIKISSFNSTRREIAKVALSRLIKDGRIQPSRIEEYVAKAKKDLEKVLFQEGRKLCQSINLFNIPGDLISILGRFKYRTSYGQNMMAHTLEVVRIGTKLAQEIGANLETIKIGCLFHDIGKVLEGEGSHVELGVKLLKNTTFQKL